MPTYDYRCDRCGVEFELWQSMADSSLSACPATGGPTECVAPGEGPVRKVFSSVGISFKGTGFYKNDHGANATSRKQSEAADSSPSSPSSDGPSSDAPKGSTDSGSSSDGSKGSADSSKGSSNGSKGSAGDTTTTSSSSSSSD